MTKLADRAMLVSLHQRTWQANVNDSEISNEMSDHYGAEPGSIRAVKKLTPDSYVRPIMQVANFGRRQHYHLTVPGMVKGQQLLATSLYDRYIAAQEQIKDEFDKAVRDFCDIYPEIKEAAPKRLGNAFKEDDFPSVEKIKTFFEYTIAFSPVPNVDDWRLEGLTDLDENSLRRQAEERVATMYENTVEEVFGKIKGALNKMIEQINQYDENKKGLRDITVQNVQEITEIAMMMNVTNNPLITEIGHRMFHEFKSLDGKMLRQDAHVRGDVKTRIEDMLNKIKEKQAS